MRIELLNTELFIKLNKLKEVSNPITLDRGMTPTPDGLLSTDIFGTTPKERKNRYSYIDLHTYFLQPLAFKQLHRLDSKIDALIAGTKKFIITKEGYLEENDAGETGIDWLYDNWEKIKFKRNQSTIRNERIDFFVRNKKDVIFTRYFIVEPAFYRDINLQNVGTGRPTLHEINVGSDQTNGSSYGKLLRLVSSLKSSGGFAFALNNTKYQIQLCMVDIYNYFKSRVEKKYGIIRKGVMGKTVDFGSRLVISAPHFDANSYNDLIVNSEYSGVPLGNCISNATPFFIGWLSGFFKREFEGQEHKYPVMDEKGEISYVELKNPAAYYNDDYCMKLMNKYIHSYEERFDKIEVPLADGTFRYMVFKGSTAKDTENNPQASGISQRYMTLTDLMFLAADDIYENRYGYITRYPFLTFQTIFPTKIRVLSTQKTQPMWINGKLHKFYPVIDPNTPKKTVPTQFIEVLMMSNVYLEKIGGDYDGDQVSIRTMFTQEANEECKRICDSIITCLNANGSNVRTSEKECIQTLYLLTRD